VVGSNLEPERGFCRTLRRDTSAIVDLLVRFGEEVEMGGNVQRAGT